MSLRTVKPEPKTVEPPKRTERPTSDESVAELSDDDSDDDFQVAKPAKKFKVSPLFCFHVPDRPTDCQLFSLFEVALKKLRKK